MARVDLVRAGAQRVALAATGIVAALYVLIAVAVVLIVSHNLTSNVDGTLSRWLTSMAADRQTVTRGEQARSNLIQAELLIGPVLLLVVFLGALAIGRRVASPIEQARQRQMDFTANASHELRTPLAVIQAQTSLALASPRNTDWYRRAFAR